MSSKRNSKKEKARNTGTFIGLYRDHILSPNEKSFQLCLESRKKWVSLDQNRPDFWNGKYFVEIKIGVSSKEDGFRWRSKHFPYLYFNTDVDRQIQRYPRPLLVIVYDALWFPPQELTRKLFEVVDRGKECDLDLDEGEERRKYVEWKANYVQKRRQLEKESNVLYLEQIRMMEKVGAFQKPEPSPTPHVIVNNYQCRHCDFFRVFKLKCDLFNRQVEELKPACKFLEINGEKVTPLCSKVMESNEF